MQIQLTTDNHIRGSEGLRRHAEQIISDSLGRFSERITRVEAHLSDQNSSSKIAENDKKCVMEARLAGLQPITVTHLADTVEQALSGAADKLEQTLERTLGRLESQKGRGSAAG